MVQDTIRVCFFTAPVTLRLDPLVINRIIIVNAVPINWWLDRLAIKRLGIKIRVILNLLHFGQSVSRVCIVIGAPVTLRLYELVKIRVINIIAVPINRVRILIRDIFVFIHLFQGISRVCTIITAPVNSRFNKLTIIRVRIFNTVPVRCWILVFLFFVE